MSSINHVYVSINKEDNTLFQIFWSLGEMRTGIKTYNELGLNIFKYYQITSPDILINGPYSENYVKFMIISKQAREVI